MKTIFKSLLFLVLLGISGFFSYSIAVLMAIGSLQNKWIITSFSIFAFLSLVSAFIIVFKDRVNFKLWHVIVLWLVYLSPAIFVFSFVFVLDILPEYNQLNKDKKEVGLLMEKFHKQALPQGGYPDPYFFSISGYGAVCNGDWTNESHPAHQVSDTYRILGKGDRELALNSVSCISDKDGYAFSVKFSDGTIKCIDKTGYFGSASALNTGTVCLK